MKKHFLFFLALISIVSCTKKVTTNTEPANTTIDSTSAISKAALKEIDKESLSKLMQTKNDTLYVVNFFATWCGPCVKEIPFFVKLTEEQKQKPFKMVFIDLDSKSEWTEVEKFVDEKGIRANTLLLDSNTLDAGFYKNNFESWDGAAIPFTYIRKGEKKKEFFGMVDEAELVNTINNF